MIYIRKLDNYINSEINIDINKKEYYNITDIKIFTIEDCIKISKKLKGIHEKNQFNFLISEIRNDYNRTNYINNEHDKFLGLY